MNFDLLSMSSLVPDIFWSDSVSFGHGCYLRLCILFQTTKSNYHFLERALSTQPAFPFIWRSTISFFSLCINLINFETSDECTLDYQNHYWQYEFHIISSHFHSSLAFPVTIQIVRLLLKEYDKVALSFNHSFNTFIPMHKLKEITVHSSEISLTCADRNFRSL